MAAKRWFTVVAMCAVASACGPEDAPGVGTTSAAAPCVKLGALDAHANAGGREISVLVDRYKLSGCEAGPTTVYFGGDPEPPENYIGRVRIVLDGDTVFVPSSAYSDLGDAGDLRVVPRDGSFVVQMAGEREESWASEWTISGGKLVKRRVWSRVFPEFSEATAYHYPDEGR